MSDLDALTARIQRLETQNRRLQQVLLAGAVLLIGCGAATTTANYGHLSSHTIAVFGANEQGEAISLGRTAAGGQLILRDAAGKTRVTLDVDGLTVVDPSERGQ